MGETGPGVGAAGGFCGVGGGVDFWGSIDAWPGGRLEELLDSGTGVDAGGGLTGALGLPVGRLGIVSGNDCASASGPPRATSKV